MASFFVAAQSEINAHISEQHAREHLVRTDSAAGFTVTDLAVVVQSSISAFDHRLCDHRRADPCPCTLEAADALISMSDIHKAAHTLLSLVGNDETADAVFNMHGMIQTSKENFRNSSITLVKPVHPGTKKSSSPLRFTNPRPAQPVELKSKNRALLYQMDAASKKATAWLRRSTRERSPTKKVKEAILIE
jgi:hypothetical protein